jgi:hypothetical protein
MLSSRSSARSAKRKTSDKYGRRDGSAKAGRSGMRVSHQFETKTAGLQETHVSNQQQSAFFENSH